MLEAVECFVEPTDHPFNVIVVALGRFYKEQLINFSVEGGGLNVHLIDVQIVEGCNCKEHTKGHGFDYCCKRLIEVYSELLQISFDYCDGVKARPRPRRSAIAGTKMTGDTESYELTEWQVVGWIY